MRMMRLNPISFQTIMMVIATRATRALDRKATRGRPTLVKMLFSSPNCTWYIRDQMTEITTMDVTTGAKIAERTAAENRSSRWRKTARASDRAICGGTLRSTYCTVTLKDFQKM